ncbi:MAG TPA: glycosyltransferase [Opitutaceae bacterium]
MTPPLGRLSEAHLETIRTHFDQESSAPTGAARSYGRLLAHYYNLLIPPDASVLEVGCGDGGLLAQIRARKKTGIDLSSGQIARARERLPDATFHVQSGECLDLSETFDVIIISETLNLAADVQRMLDRVASVATPETRLLLNFHNNLWRPVFAVANALGARTPPPMTSWLSSHDIDNLLEMSRWEIIKRQPRLLWPIATPVIAPLLNRWIAPFVPFAGFAIFVVARLRPEPAAVAPSVSVVVPARNEAGNIEQAVLRTPEMGAWTELIFIEGHSKDNTWDEIQRVQQAYPQRRIKILRQTGKGKGNAVREAFAVATGDVLMILDADLTMPPEELPKFYEAIASSKAEFANGSRLVYPMEKGAMQFLNMIANKFFGLAFSWLLGQSLKDTLCGTKVLRRQHYLTIAANRAYFGEFDPFGDFDLLFGADKLNLKIRDIPIRYRERTYGTTNIQRWRHGLLLFRMLGFAARKLKFV